MVATNEGARVRLPLGNVLVTGGCGFLGHHIVHQLLHDCQTESVSVVDLRCSHNRKDGARYFEADITDADKLAKVFADAKPDVVIHTASPLAAGDDVSSKELYDRVNVDGTKNVIAACQNAGVTALVYTSSASIVSDNENDIINADERWPVLSGKMQPVYYSETKVWRISKLEQTPPVPPVSKVVARRR